ncbi:MAG: hypothetical protein VKJ24_11440 [Synechococcales bacterium]|nr:hypothetical protein [Synechococcales bacterium]
MGWVAPGEIAVFLDDMRFLGMAGILGWARGFWVGRGMRAPTG